MKSKMKIGLSTLIPIATVGAVTPLATACSQANTVIKHVHQSSDDIKYGLSANTYKQLKKDYESKFNAKLDQEGLQEGSALRQQKLNDFNLALNSFDNSANTMCISYGELTSGLINYAKSTDGIQLRRITNVRWSDINAMFQGAYDSFDLYMTHEHFSESQKKQILSDATLKFNEFVDNLETQGYKENDPYGALNETRANLIVFFDSINENIAKIAAQNIINTFVKKYAIKYKRNDTGAYVNSVRSLITANVGKDISSFFNQIFYMVDYETGNQVKFSPTTMVPGYTIIPILQSYNFDDEANKFQINIVLSACKTSIYTSKDQEKIKKATAYLMSCTHVAGESDIDKCIKEDATIEQGFEWLDQQNKQVLTFNMFKTVQEEKSTIRDIYFNSNLDKYIRLKFDVAGDDLATLDPYLENCDENNKGHLNKTELFKAGLLISSDGINWKRSVDVFSSAFNKTQQSFLDPENPLYKLTLEEKFLYNCEIKSQFEMIQKNGDKFDVNNKISVEFSNKNDLDETITGKIDLDDSYICKDFYKSPAYFMNVSRNYSISKRYFNNYSKDQTSNIRQAHTKCIIWNTGLAVMGACSLALIATFTIKLFAKQGQSLYDWLGLITAIAAGGMIGYAMYELDKNILAPTDQFLRRMDSIYEKDYTKRIYDHIKQDANLLVYIDEDGHYDTTDYETKLEKYQESPTSVYKSLSDYYTNIFVDGHDGAEFRDLIEAKQVTLQDFVMIAGLWNTSASYFKQAYSFTISGGLMLITSFGFLLKTNKKEKPKEQQPEKTYDASKAEDIEQLHTDMGKEMDSIEKSYKHALYDEDCKPLRSRQRLAFDDAYNNLGRWYDLEFQEQYFADFQNQKAAEGIINAYKWRADHFNMVVEQAGLEPWIPKAKELKLVNGFYSFVG